MPDIYDLEKGLKIGLTDEDYKDYQSGNLSNDFYARRKDGSIANRVNISPLNNDHDDNDGGVSSGRIDGRSAAIVALIMAFFVGVACGIKKLCDRYKAKKVEAQTVKQHKTEVNLQKEENAQMPIKTAEANDSERKLLTQEEAIQELMKIIVGMSEIVDGKKKVLEGVENLSNTGIVDREALLEKLSDPKVLEGFNTYLENNPQLLMQNHTILDGIFGRSLAVDGQYVPLAVSDIERQLRTETIQEE